MNKITVSKWGNSLGIRLPKHVVEAFNINESSVLLYGVKDDSLVITKTNDNYNDFLDNCQEVTTTQNQEVWNDATVGLELL